MDNKKLVSWLEHKKNEVNSYRGLSPYTSGFMGGQLELIEELLLILSKPSKIYQD